MGKKKEDHMGKIYVLSLEMLHIAFQVSVGQNVITRPHLTGREAGKCSLAGGRTGLEGIWTIL